MKGLFCTSSFSDNGKKRFYYISYTVLFGVVAFFCFSWFIFSGKSLIWEGDGWSQHFKALVYYSDYLQSIIRHLLSDHKLIIPEWDFYIGEGSDIISALHYYVIGDPLALLSVFIPTRFMHYFFSFSCILRLYLAGAAFSALCFGTGQKNKYAVLTGSIAYSFCVWALMGATRHPYFVNPMIYFPLMILGIEKIIRKGKPYLFIAAAAVSAASNFFFFYIIVILAVVYTVLRLGFVYGRDVKKAVLKLLYMGVMAVIGVCIAGLILLPVLMIFLNDSRLSISQPFHWLYPLSYYSKLPSMAVSDNGDFWLFMGFAPPVLLSVIVLFLKKKEDRFLKVLFTICIAIILFPIGGRILNGMSYMSNRWSWAFALLCVFILVREWDDLISLPGKLWIKLTIISTVYFAICLLFDKSRSESVFAAVAMLFLTLIIVRKDPAEKNNVARKQILLLLLVSVGVVNIAFWMFSPGAGNYVAEFIENRRVWEDWKNNEAAVVSKISDSDFTRISGTSLTFNSNIFFGISSTQYFWSISNPYVNQYRMSLNTGESTFFNYHGYNDRATPTALAAVNYYVLKGAGTAKPPYGYSLVETVDADVSEKKRIDKLKSELGVDSLTSEQTKKISEGTSNVFSIYKNDYTLPIAYCYDSYYLKDVWDSFNPVQKQEAQLEAAYVDADLDGVEKKNLTMPDYLVPYTIETQGIEISQHGNSFVTTAKNAQIKITLNKEIDHSEAYFGFSGLEFSPTHEYDLYFGDESVDPLNLYNKTNWEALSRDRQISIRKDRIYWDKVQDTAIDVESSTGKKRSIHYKQPDSNFSNGRHDYIANFGYTEDPVSAITITFTGRGIYSFKSMDVYGIPMKGFGEKIADLQKDTLQNIVFGTNTVSGDITLSDDRLMCFATPYSKGWKAYVDGNETEVHCVNERYSGIVVPEGHHDILFKYHMPYKKAGLFISLSGIIALIALLIFDYMKKKTGTVK